MAIAPEIWLLTRWARSTCACSYAYGLVDIRLIMPIGLPAAISGTRISERIPASVGVDPGREFGAHLLSGPTGERKGGVALDYRFDHRALQRSCESGLRPLLLEIDAVYVLHAERAAFEVRG